MKVKREEYDYRIEPWRGWVRAEVFKIIKHEFSDRHDEIHLASKEFGGLLFHLKKKHYEKAREWAENQLQLIYHANKD